MTAHVHAALMLQYAQDAAETDKPWERWEGSDDSGDSWQEFTDDERPVWDESWIYRRKPRTIKVNGFDVPDPMQTHPEKHAQFWIVDLTSEECTCSLVWRGDSFDMRALSRGLIHSTKEAAAKHAMAMCGIDPATYKDES